MLNTYTSLVIILEIIPSLKSKKIIKITNFLNRLDL